MNLWRLIDLATSKLSQFNEAKMKAQ
ncbi:unnamed protein product, partial [Rotaria socialis]